MQPAEQPPTWSWDNKASWYQTKEIVDVKFDIKGQNTIEINIETVSRNIFQKLYNATFQQFYDTPVEFWSRSQSTKTVKVDNLTNIKDLPEEAKKELDQLRASNTVHTPEEIKRFISDILSPRLQILANRTNDVGVRRLSVPQDSNQAQMPSAAASSSSSSSSSLSSSSPSSGMIAPNDSGKLTTSSSSSAASLGQAAPPPKLATATSSSSAPAAPSTAKSIAHLDDNGLWGALAEFLDEKTQVSIQNNQAMKWLKVKNTFGGDIIKKAKEDAAKFGKPINNNTPIMDKAIFLDLLDKEYEALMNPAAPPPQVAGNQPASDKPLSQGEVRLMLENFVGNGIQRLQDEINTTVAIADAARQRTAPPNPNYLEAHQHANKALKEAEEKQTAFYKGEAAIRNKISTIKQQLQQGKVAYTRESLLAAISAQLKNSGIQLLSSLQVQTADLLNDPTLAGQFNVTNDYKQGVLLRGGKLDPANPVGVNWTESADHTKPKTLFQLKKLKFSVMSANALHRRTYKYIDPNNKLSRNNQQGLVGSAITKGMQINNHTSALDPREQAVVEETIDALTHPTNPTNILCLQELSSQVRTVLMARLGQIKDKQFNFVIPFKTKDITLLEVRNPSTNNMEKSRVDNDDCGMIIYDAKMFKEPTDLTFMNYYERGKPNEHGKQTDDLKDTKYAFAATFTARDTGEQVRILNTHAQTGRIKELSAKMPELHGRNPHIPMIVVGDFNESAESVRGKINGINTRPGGTTPTAGGFWSDYDGIILIDPTHQVSSIEAIYDPKEIYHGLDHQTSLTRTLYHVNKALSGDQTEQQLRAAASQQRNDLIQQRVTLHSTFWLNIQKHPEFAQASPKDKPLILLEVQKVLSQMAAKSYQTIQLETEDFGKILQQNEAAPNNSANAPARALLIQIAKNVVSNIPKQIPQPQQQSVPPQQMQYMPPPQQQWQQQPMPQQQQSWQQFHPQQGMHPSQQMPPPQPQFMLGQQTASAWPQQQGAYAPQQMPPLQPQPPIHGQQQTAQFTPPPTQQPYVVMPHLANFSEQPQRAALHKEYYDTMAQRFSQTGSERLKAGLDLTQEVLQEMSSKNYQTIEDEIDHFEIILAQKKNRPATSGQYNGWNDVHETLCGVFFIAKTKKKFQSPP